MPPDPEAATENYFLLMDPSWRPDPGTAVPPADAVIGLWPLTDDGTVGRFRGNPDYHPRDAGSATDPVDAVLRLMVAGQAPAEHLQVMLCDTLVDVAMNDDGRPLIVASPDRIPCVVVATGAPHRRRLDPPAWHRVDLADLVHLLADGVDVLVNPRGPAATRLTGVFIRDTMLLTDDELAAARGRMRPAVRVTVVPWELRVAG